MLDYEAMEQTLARHLRIRRRPVAVAFRDAPPAGVEKFGGREPSGCSFWRVAAGGRAFYTLPGDHENCVIGSHTHNIPLSGARAKELEETLGFMTGIGYLRLEEVAGIPRLPRTPGVVVYAPLAQTPVDPDVVIFAGRPARVMLLQEAAIRAGVAAHTPALGRPTCMALPAALPGGVVASTGCVGNRVYTDVGEDELYVVVAGGDLSRIVDEIETVAAANARLFDYHRERRQALATD